jgi:hypothetical protein
MKPAEKFILITLDSILDTRQGTLLKISPEVAYEITSKEDYHARQSDTFVSEKYGELSPELFQQVKEKFKHEIIFNSLKTKMYLFLQELIEGYVKLSLSTPHASIITLEVNIHPYKFTETQAEYLLKALIAHLGNSAAISIVDFDIKELSLKTIADKYDSVIMYNPVDWLNSRHNELKMGVLKELTLYIPKINTVRDLTDKERKNLNKNISDVYKFTQMVFAGFIKINYVPVECYCADVPYVKREKEKDAA